MGAPQPVHEQERPLSAQGDPVDRTARAISPRIGPLDPSNGHRRRAYGHGSDVRISGRTAGEAPLTVRTRPSSKHHLQDHRRAPRQGMLSTVTFAP